MIEADSVLSTPPTNTSANNPPDQPMTHDDKLGMAWWNALTKQERAKWSAIAGNTGRVKDAWEAFKRGSIDQSPPQTRRRFITVAAGASVVSVGALAVAAMPASGPACAADPIYAAIDRHRAATVVWDAAVDVWAKFSDGPAPMPIERRIERERINDAQEAARDALDDTGVDLINTSPTTLGGIARGLNYIREQMRQDDGIYMPSGFRLSDDTDGEYPVAWIEAFLDTIEHAATELDEAGKAVRS